MNDWDSMEEQEPLDARSLGLLASYREARAPSEDAQARMLAGLRARIAAESCDPATAVRAQAGPSTVPEGRAQMERSQLRTLAVAAVAFAAGVALTLSLGTGRDASSDSTDPDRGAGGHHSAGPRVPPSGPRLETSGAFGESAHAPAVPEPSLPAEPRPWPLTVADLVVPNEPEEAEDGGMPQTVDAPPAAVCDDEDDVAATASRRRVRSPDEDALTRRGSPSGDADPPGAALGGGSTAGAWAPSVGPSPTTSGIGAAARNDAVGGAPSPGSPGSPGGQNGKGSPDGAPRDDAPSPDGDPAPSPEEPPPTSDDPPPEDEPHDEDPSDDEGTLAEQCDAELQACISDAETFCAWNPEGCELVFQFCHERVGFCMGGEPLFPSPEDPPEPEPMDCFQEYDMCMAETDSLCMTGKAPEDACEELYWQCDDMLAACEGAPPPEPPW